MDAEDRRLSPGTIDWYRATSSLHSATSSSRWLLVMDVTMAGGPVAHVGGSGHVE